MGIDDLDGVAVPGQLQLLDHQGMEEADEVGTRADVPGGIGEGLLQGARTAQPVLRFEHEHPTAGASEVGAGGQPVVAAPDDDHLPGSSDQRLDGRGQPDPSHRLLGARLGHEPATLRLAVRPRRQLAACQVPLSGAVGGSAGMPGVGPGS